MANVAYLYMNQLVTCTSRWCRQPRQLSPPSVTMYGVRHWRWQSWTQSEQPWKLRQNQQTGQPHIKCFCFIIFRQFCYWISWFFTFIVIWVSIFLLELTKSSDDRWQRNIDKIFLAGFGKYLNCTHVTPEKIGSTRSAANQINDL